MGRMTSPDFTGSNLLLSLGFLFSLVWIFCPQHDPDEPLPHTIYLEMDSSQELSSALRDSQHQPSLSQVLLPSPLSRCHRTTENILRTIWITGIQPGGVLMQVCNRHHEGPFEFRLVSSIHLWEQLKHRVAARHGTESTETGPIAICQLHTNSTCAHFGMPDTKIGRIYISSATNQNCVTAILICIGQTCVD